MLIIVVTRKEVKMTQLKENKMEVTSHWNDRFYESTECSKCGMFEQEKTQAELQVAIDNHTC